MYSQIRREIEIENHSVNRNRSEFNINPSYEDSFSEKMNFLSFT